MRRHTIVRTGLFSLAAGAVLIIGGVAEPASASPSAVVPALASDCDVPGGQPGGEHAPGGHDSHGMVGETAKPSGGHGEHGGHDLTGGTTPPAEGHEGHGSHSAGSTATAGPDSGSRTLVLGSFAGVNGVALVGAAFLRRRTASKRGRHLAARASALPAHRISDGSDR